MIRSETYYHLRAWALEVQLLADASGLVLAWNRIGGSIERVKF